MFRGFSRSSVVASHAACAAVSALGLFFIGAHPALLHAGPVPGVETFTKKPIEFPVPPHLQVWQIGEGDYLVTFRWKPTEPITQPGVAGTFNSWSRTDLPMEGPDAEGFYHVTARLKDGEHKYKFVAAPNEWFSDPLNDQKEEGSGNAILRLGAMAFLHDVKAARGDGQIEKRAFRHAPDEALYLDLNSPTDALIRFRTLAGDTQKAEIILDGANGTQREPMALAGADSVFDFYEYHLSGPAAANLRRYGFAVHDGTTTAEPADRYDWKPDAARIVKTPDWARHAIWYQVMVDRFRDGNTANNPEFVRDPRTKLITHPWRSEWYTEYPWERTDGWSFWRWSMYDRIYGGDFEGLIDELTYIKELGANAIYLNPVFVSHNSHKYNARTYVHADDGYGVAGEYQKTLNEDLLDPKTWKFNASDKMLLRVIEEAHARDMKIILDGVFNHIGDDHPAFLDVKKNGQKSRFADWFDVVSWEPFQYRGWGGYDGLPEFKKSDKGFVSDAVRDHIFAITRRWMDPNGDGDPSDGIDGWRLDVPAMVPKQFWVEWRQLVKSINPDAYITGEIWDPAEEWLDGTTYDAVMNYQLPKAAFPWFSNKKEKITATEFDNRLARLRLRYPRNCTYVLQNLFDSHDTDRWVSRIANPDLGYDDNNRLQSDDGKNYFDAKPSEMDYRRLRLMALFQFTYVGAPMIWYGTEVGMFGADDPRCRMPMWWDDMMPYDSPDYKIDKDLREEFRGLATLRNAHECLQTGDFATAVALDDADVFGYWRNDVSTGAALLVLLNNSDKEQTVRVPAPTKQILPSGYASAKLRVLHATAGTGMPAIDADALKVTLPAIGGAVIDATP